MTIPIRRRIVRSRKENEKDGRKLVFERGKGKCKGLSLRIFAIGIKSDSITVTRRQFSILAPFSPTWFAFSPSLSRFLSQPYVARRPCLIV